MDERENLPSISQFEAIALCPARFQLGLQVPEPSIDPDAQYGNEIHLAKETGDLESLSDDQRDVADAMSEQEDILLKEVFGKELLAEQYREKRFWYYRKGGPGFIHWLDQDPITTTKLFSGKLDFCAWAHSKERVSLYIDYKSLWGDTTPPARNLQLRGGAVLMKQNFGSRRAFVAILQPTKRKFAIAAEYGPEELAEAERECIRIVERAMAPGAQAVPGPEQCRYCRAKLICKVAYRKSLGQLRQTSDMTLKMADDADLDRLGHAWEVAQIIGKAIDAEIKRRKEANPESMPNYYFVPTGHTSEIADPALVWPKFSHLLSPEAFSAACKVGKGDLEKAVRAALGVSMEDAKRSVEKLLGDLLVKKPKKPSLERKPYYEIK